MPTAAATPCKPGPENMPTTSGDWLGSGDPSGGISQKRMREGELGALLGGTVPDGGLKVTCSGWGFKHTPTHESRGQPRVPPTERAARLRSSPRFTRHDSVSHPRETQRLALSYCFHWPSPPLQRRGRHSYESV